MILPVTEVRAGMAVRLEGEVFRVLDAVFHQGAGQMKGSVHLRIQSLRTRNLTERRFRPEDRVEEVELQRQPMEYLYDEDQRCVFMHPETFEQVSLERAALGAFARFIRPNQRLELEFLDDQPVGVVVPRAVELRVERTAAPVHGQETNVFKEAVLENGVEVLVPQFIRPGDLVRVEVETGKYLDRVR
ncbi:MAG TPA: hypothetical protein VNI61_11895 [Gemmatimonadales bacterium]|nr:hypothetical protein [Gemmatimonadales bacterium]